MTEFFSKLFSSDFMPHGHCYLWRPEILWLNVGSDVLIALSYYSIPLALLVFVRRRGDLVYHWMFVLFAAFIFLCGTTHVVEIWTVWHGSYRIEGVVKLLTGLVSLATAVLLWRLVPQALRLPSPSQYAGELETRRAIEQQLLLAQRDLELKVEKRTRELSETVRELEEFNRMAVGREEQMIELKKQINELRTELGRKPVFDIMY